MINTATRSLLLSGSTLSASRQSVRLISFTTPHLLKKIERTESADKKQVTIEGKYIDSSATFGNKVLNLSDDHAHQTTRPCSWCLLENKGIRVQYTDVLVIRQFVKEDGELLPRKVTGLCNRQHKKLNVLVKQAKRAGLILELQPRLLDGSQPNADPHRRPEHLKYNAYFDKYEVMKRTNKYL